MKIRRIPGRISIRRAMVAVALVAVCLAAVVAVMRRREEFRRLSREYARESVNEMLLGHHAAYSTNFGPSLEDLKTLRAHEDLSDHFARLKSKYERAATRPWLPVGVDPPPPVWPAGVRRHELKPSTSPPAGAGAKARG